MIADRCPSCGDRKFLRCSECGGGGYSVEADSGIRQLCPLCDGDGGFSCGLCGGIEREESELKDTIVERLQNLSYFDKATTDRLAHLFNSLYLDNVILSAIEDARKESLRQRFNRHDLRHALVVTSHALDLFANLSLRQDLNHGGFRSTSEAIRGSSKVVALSAVLISGFAHDLGRGFQEHERTAAILMQAGGICESHLKFIDSDYVRQQVVSIVARCIQNHSGSVSLRSLEESIVALADGLDCDQFRVQPVFPPDLVLREDPSPIEYFSCLDITRTEIRCGQTAMVEVLFRIQGLASMLQVGRFISRLENTIFANPANRDKLHVVVSMAQYLPDESWQSQKLKIWPQIEWLAQ